MPTRGFALEIAFEVLFDEDAFDFEVVGLATAGLTFGACLALLLVALPTAVLLAIAGGVERSPSTTTRTVYSV